MGLERTPLFLDVCARRAEVRRPIERTLRLVPPAKLRQGPGTSELRRGIRWLAREDRVVGRERSSCIAANHRDRRETEEVLGALRIRGETLLVRLLRAVVVVEVQSREAEHVERLGVLRAATNGFFETRDRFLGLAPTRRPHPAFARSNGRGWGDARRRIVGRKRFVEPMRELERVTELDPRNGIVRHLFLKNGDLRLRSFEIAGPREDANEEASCRKIVGMRREMTPEDVHRLCVFFLPHELLGAIDRAERRARRQRDAEDNEHARSDFSHAIVVSVPRPGSKWTMEIRTIGVLGAGQMGGGIAQVAAAASYDVVLVDATSELAEKGKAKINAILGKQVEKGKLDAAAKDALVGRIKIGASPAAFEACDLVVEAATENVDLKLKLFKGCDDAMKPGAILASNTSSISLTKLAGSTKRPDKVIGMHFMNPPPLMKLVEIVRAVQTSEETYRVVRATAEKMGKTCTVSNDAPGFLVNRILIPMLCEACFALQEGVGSPEDIDTGAKLGLNHPMGPLELSDLIGLDTVLAIADVLHRDIGDDKYRAPTMLRNLVAAGWLGKKTGRGFYVYEDGQKKSSALR